MKKDDAKFLHLRKSVESLADCHNNRKETSVTAYSKNEVFAKTV